MVDLSTAKFEQILTQKNIPVAIRYGRGHKLYVKLPFSDDNRSFLTNGRRTKVVWLKAEQRWELPSSWFDDFVERALRRYGRLYVIQPYHEQEICAPACRNARGHVCQCSCMGANHGAGDGSGWFDVSETFSVRWHGSMLAARLMTASKAKLEYI